MTTNLDLVLLAAIAVGVAPVLLASLSVWVTEAVRRLDVRAHRA